MPRNTLHQIDFRMETRLPVSVWLERVIRVVGLWVLSGASASAVLSSQFEDFSRPTTWTSGAVNPNPPLIVTDSGPEGDADSALMISSSFVSGAGSRLAAYDKVTWVGNFTQAGVNLLRMDLRNSSAVASTMRVAVHGPGGWWVTPGHEMSLFSPWQQVEFDLRAESLLAADGGGLAADTLASVDEIRILHSSTVSFRGGTGERSVFVDNIQAVPEPSVMAWGLSWLFLLLRRRRVHPGSH